MAGTSLKAPSFDHTVMLKLARELAMDIYPLEKILEVHGVPWSEWEIINKNSVFQSYLRSSIEEWQSAVNTGERVKLKSLAFVEEALPEFFARAHDASENLSAKTEVLKTIAKFAGVGGTVDGTVSGEKFSVTINLGADRQVKIERDVTPQVIDGDADE